MRTRSLILALLVNAALPLLRSQTPAAVESGAPAPTAPAAAAAPAAPAHAGEGTAVVLTTEAPTTISEKTKDTLSVDFPDEEIRSILRNVADLFELNLVVPETLQGKTSIKLRDVTWRQIFQVTLAPVGYTFVEDGNIIKIVTVDSLNLEPVTTDVFVINYAKAEDIKKSVEPLVEAAAGGRVIVDTRSNALVISERPTRLTRIRSIVERLDKATDQVMIESKFIEVTDRDVKNLGVKWNSLAGYQISAGPFNQTFNRSRTGSYNNGVDSNAGSSNGSSNGTTSGTNTTNSVGSDSTSRVTSDNGVINSTSGTGSNASLNNTVTNGTSADTTNALSNALNSFQSLAGGGTTGRLTSAVFDADQFQVILSALQTLNDIKIVSNPTVVTLNNTESSINVGEEFPIPNYTYNQERGTFEVSGFQYRPIGIILKVTPQVNSQGFIKLNVEPEVSQRNGETSFGGAGGATIPIIATRKAKTQVSLKDGFTMGLGGLITARSENGSTKVPVLGDIPGLGKVFRSKNRDHSTTNLLIFITAKTVAADGAPITEVFDSRNLRAIGLKKEELPGYRDAGDPFAQPEAPAPEPKKSFFRRSAPAEQAPSSK
ncbi:MAG: secretin N-terminal domain-containing protein [Opitutaceae bacterium]